MITLKDSIKIKATPQKVYEGVIERLRTDEAYVSWHHDHVELCWIKGEPLKEGSVVYAEEYLNGELQKLKFRIVKIVLNREIVYRPLFPYSLFAPGNTWLFRPKGENSCIFTAMGRLRGGPLYKKLGAKRLKAIAMHMQEEGENLKKALEMGRPQT